MTFPFSILNNCRDVYTCLFHCRYIHLDNGLRALLVSDREEYIDRGNAADMNDSQGSSDETMDSESDESNTDQRSRSSKKRDDVQEANDQMPMQVTPCSWYLSTNVTQ